MVLFSMADCILMGKGFDDDDMIHMESWNYFIVEAV